MLEEARERLLAGEVVAFPTETFFGLAVDPRNDKAVAKLLELKGRDSSISLIIDSSKRIDEIIAEESPEVQSAREELVAKHWPGPLTLVINPKDIFSSDIYARDGSLALRCSSHQLARDLAALMGGAITATSANPNAEDPARTVDKAREYFPNIFVLDGSVGGEKKASTIVDVRELPFKVLREGPIKL